MKATLLIVDDEPDSLEPMRLILEGHYRILTATNGDKALALLESERVEMIIADQRMPGMSGVELLTRIRETHPGIVRLILTAYTDFDAMITAINEGQVYRYIIKPWDVNDMRLTIQQALEWQELINTKGQLAADLSEAHRSLLKRTQELERAMAKLVEQEKLAAVGRFAAEMVHDMNNYLQVIMAVNESLVNLNSEDLEQVKEIGNYASMLAEIAASIRDFALGAAMPFSPSIADPVLVANEVARLCSRLPDFLNIRLRVESIAKLTWTIDPRQIRHLLLNLLKNAAKSSPDNGVIVLSVGQEDGQLVFRVIDHGHGVPPKLREQIWEPFYTTHEMNGSGLGLNICREVVSAHGGTIHMTDTAGGGATFTICIPRPQGARTESDQDT